MSQDEYPPSCGHVGSNVLVRFPKDFDPDHPEKVRLAAALDERERDVLRTLRALVYSRLRLVDTEGARDALRGVLGDIATMQQPGESMAEEFARRTS